MKNYTITVNGNVYEVTVEEGSTSGAKSGTGRNSGLYHSCGSNARQNPWR